MSDRPLSSRLTRLTVRSLATDIAMVALWRFGFRHSWHVSLIVGAVMLTASALLVLHSWWWHKDPDRVRSSETWEARRAEKVARQAAAAEAAHRASGRR